MSKAEKIGIWIGATTLVVSSAIALAAWQWPQPVREKPPWEKEAVAAPSVSPRTAPATVPATQNKTYLADLFPHSGGANMTSMPRALTGKDGYDHPIVVRCPTNQSDDKMRSVTYLLRGRYLDFSATVRPYYSAERDARTYVHAVTGVKERDGTVTQQTRGTQFAATMAAPATLAAAVDGAEELTIQVQCESPEGVVVFSGALVTPAA
jgi:hypothetical protein